MRNGEFAGIAGQRRGDLSSDMAAVPAKRRRRAKAPAGGPTGRPRPGRAPIVLCVLMAIGGAVGAGISFATPPIAAQVLSSPGRGMVETATGTGGPDPTQTVTNYPEPSGIAGASALPDIPTLYLKPAVVQSSGAAEAAYWEVWWDDSTQVKAVVSLQRHLSDSDAATALTDVDIHNADVSSFNNSVFDFTRSSDFSVLGIPGARGYVWDGTETLQGGTVVPIEFRFATFSRGETVALVSMTAYNGHTDPAAFQSFVSAEYSQMGTVRLFPVLLFGLLFVAGLVLCTILSVRRSRLDTRAAAGYSPWGPGYPPFGAGYPAPGQPYPGWPYPPPYPPPAYAPPYPPPAYAPPYPPPAYAPPAYPPPPPILPGSDAGDESVQGQT